MEEENSLLRKLLIFWNGRNTILSSSIICAIIALAYAFYLPPIYKAECYILPPNQFMNKLGIFVSLIDQSERIGGLNNNPALSETVTSGQMMLGLIKRNSIVDSIIDKFGLMEVYKQTSRDRMRDLLIKKLMETNDDPKSGILSIGILDENPQRAADIANAFIDVLQEKMLNLALNEAAQRRAFFEKQLFQARQYLDSVQKEMLDYQETLGGLAIPQSQMEATLRAITDLEQQIADKKVEISAMRTYASSTNPRLIAANSQLDAMTKELARLEDIQKNSSPQLSVEYQRYATRVQYAAKNYETLLQKLEEARLDASQGFFYLHVVDYATPPDVKYKPSRARILILGTFIGGLLGCALVVFSNFSRGLRKSIQQFKADNPDIINKADDDYDNYDASDNGGKHSLRRLVSVIMALAPAVVIIAAVMLLTFQTPQASEELSAKFQSILKTFWGSGNYPAWVTNMMLLRAFAHVFLYLPVSAAVYYAMKHFTKSWPKAAFAAFIISCAIGLADEAVKMYLPDREFDFADWTLDIIGIIAGLAICLLCRMLYTLRREKLSDEN